MKKRAFTVTEYSLTAHCSPSGAHCEARHAESRRCARAGGAEPICAALISDTHGRIIDDLAEAAAEAAPDLILVPGDAIENKRPGHPDGVRMLARLAAVAPVFFSVGNHERALSREQTDGLAEAGIHCVDLSTERFSVRGTQLCIGGVPSASYENGERCGTSLAELLFTPRARAELPQKTVDYIAEFSAEGGAKLLLCHHPEYYRRYLRDCDTGIICAGHAHGGQIRLFGHGLYAPGQGFFPRYTSGVHDGRFVISRGLTNHSFPPRIFNRPELVILHIYSESSDTSER